MDHTQHIHDVQKRKGSPGRGPNGTEKTLSSDAEGSEKDSSMGLYFRIFSVGLRFEIVILNLIIEGYERQDA